MSRVPLLGWRGFRRRRILLAAFFKAHDDDVENRSKKQTKASHAQHPEEPPFQRLAHFRAGAAARDKRQDAKR